MAGVVTKRHFLTVAKEFGIKAAFRLLVSREPVALTTLISFN